MEPKMNFHPTKVKIDGADRLIRGFTYVFVGIFAVMCIIPFWMIIAS